MQHHVYFHLKEDHRNESDRAIFERRLSELFHIRWVTGGAWGVPAKVEPRPVCDQSWDYALVMEFANLEGHDAYQSDEAHLEFVDTFRDWWEKVVVHDLEIDISLQQS